MGGEKCVSGTWLKCLSGSPPHGQGKVRICFCFGEKLKITPAWAGKSFILPDLMEYRRDHPCVGGEKTKSIHPYPVLDGSPPHGRGRVGDSVHQIFTVGITPAWAGKSRAEASCGCARRDHPRVGEEKKALLTVRQALKGSPPRRRGKGSSRPA